MVASIPKEWIILCKKLDPEAIIPTRNNPEDAGLDLYANRAITIKPRTHVSVATGVAVAIPEGYVGLVCPRSGVAKKHGITVLNAPGIVDSGYHGEVAVLLYNASPYEYLVKKGDRVAQLVITTCWAGSLKEVDDFYCETSRGTKGFGSSGN